MDMVDSHFHLVSPDRERYPLHAVPLATRMPEHEPEKIWLEWRASPEQFLAKMDDAGVDKALIAHSYPTYGYDCSFTVDAATAFPERFRAMVQFDPDDPAPGKLLEEMAKSPAVRGVRIRALFEPRLLEPGAERIWDAAARSGLTIDVLVGSLIGVAQWVERVAPVAVVVHAGMPPELMGLGSPPPPDSQIAALAALPNCYFKVTTPFLQAAPNGDPAVLVDQVAATFGADRMAWGTNYPATSDISYSDMAALGRHSARNLSEDDRAAYLGSTAMRLWSWDPGQVA